MADTGRAYEAGNERIRSQERGKKQHSIKQTLFSLFCGRPKRLNFLENSLNTMGSRPPASGLLQSKNNQYLT